MGTSRVAPSASDRLAETLHRACPACENPDIADLGHGRVGPDGLTRVAYHCHRCETRFLHVRVFPSVNGDRAMRSTSDPGSSSRRRLATTVVVEVGPDWNVPVVRARYVEAWQQAGYMLADANKRPAALPGRDGYLVLLRRVAA